MTISINVSVNGNYKVPVTTKYGENEPVTEVISGRGHDGPFVKTSRTTTVRTRPTS